MCNLIRSVFVLYTVLNVTILCGAASLRSPSIIDDPSCGTVKQYCARVQSNDLEILECLQSDPSYINNLDANCQHVVWNRTSQLISNENVQAYLSSVCDNDHSFTCKLDKIPGSFLKCAINLKDDITTRNCVTAITRFENIAFDDLNFISSFLTHCEADVNKYKCGRLSGDSSSQGETLSCLQTRYRDIGQECQKEILKLSEIQSDNIKLDRQLYMSCANDQMRYCKQFAPGSGKVFKCLMQHFDEKLEEKCREHLLRRQKLILEDYKISKGLMRACKDDIKKAHCRRQTSEDKSIRLAQVLFCLENVIKNGTKVDSDCEAEMRDQRKILMEDYRLSPEIVDSCSMEIKKFCNNLEVGGKTLHCLMEHARLKHSKKRIRDTCQRSLEKLVKEADVAEDWRVDRVLYDACAPVVKAACSDLQGGQGKVMSCLMDNIGEEIMTEDCEDALIQIQYFVARDFKLDAQLFKSCRDDAGRLCNAGREWEESQQPELGPLVLPCLYRHAYHQDKESRLKTKCLDQIKRVMRQRSLSVDLNPKIEEDCLDDLAMLCFEKTGKGEEIECLQTNLEKVSPECKDTISDFTEIEAEHVELNPYIMKNCKEVMQKLCHSEMQSEDGDVMNCLISHKNDPMVKSHNRCKVSIEHFQIISLKDIRFSAKFKLACKTYAIKYCKNEKSKTGVVSCLSQKVVNDTMLGIKSEIQKECRQQLRAQLFQQRENIDFDPKLAAACSVDISRYCANVPHGSAQVLECLQSTSEPLSKTCQTELFKVKKEEITDNAVDYALISNCGEEIDQFCAKTEPEHVLDCLKKHKDSHNFGKKCRQIVIHRMIEQNSDYRLNPALHENCKDDIHSFCSEIIAAEDPSRELNGKVVKCLRNAFRHSKLTEKCEREMTVVLRQQALDFRLNPLLKVVCKDELSTICKFSEDEDAGKAEECLKNAFLDKKIPTSECRNEVVLMIETSAADINADPLLQQACALDLLKYCSNVPQGSGRHIKCLKTILVDTKRVLSPECSNMFKARVQMYKEADRNAPEDLQQLYDQVVASPAKHYFFFVILMIIGTLFLAGILCGRVTKRHMLLKNK